MPNQPKTPHTSFRLPPELKARARAYAEAEGVTLTALVVRALERELDEGEGAGEPIATRRRANVVCICARYGT